MSETKRRLFGDRRCARSWRPRPTQAVLLLLLIVALAAVRVWAPQAKRSPSAPRQSPAYSSPTRISSETTGVLPQPSKSASSSKRIANVQAKQSALALEDFRLILPLGWQRRHDLEEQGPGTKLFLQGPVIGAGPVYIGIDVYPLPAGMTLSQFVQHYKARWGDTSPIQEEAAELCKQPARMLVLKSGPTEKILLFALYRGRGYVIGMFGPSGQREANVRAFKSVLDSFQFYR